MNDKETRATNAWLFWVWATFHPRQARELVKRAGQECDKEVNNLKKMLAEYELRSQIVWACGTRVLDKYRQGSADQEWRDLVSALDHIKSIKNTETEI